MLICEVCSCSPEDRQKCADALLARGGYRADGLPTLLSSKEARQLRWEEEKQAVPLDDPEALEACKDRAIPRVWIP